MPEVDLPETYNLCDQEGLVVNVPTQYEDVTWSDGRTDEVRLIQETGVYSFEAYYDCHIVCHEFEVFGIPEEISLGNDLSTCDDFVTIYSSVDATWNTGEIGSFITVQETGEYRLFLKLTVESSEIQYM